jgi:phosphonate transport system substrate-binding protein
MNETLRPRSIDAAVTALIRRAWRSVRLIAAVALLTVAMTTPAVQADTAAGPAPLEIAIAPFLPPQVLLAHYQAMRAHLERALARPVTFLTAPDYRSYNDRLLHQELQIAIAVASSATLAIVDAGYQPLLRPTTYTRPTVVVAATSTIQNVADLRGKIVGTTDPMGIVAMQGINILESAGLDPASSVQVKHLMNHAAAVNYVISGEVDAAIISDRALSQLPEASRNGVRQLLTWDAGAAPGVVYLASPNMPAELVSAIKLAIVQFADDTEEGQALMGKLGYGRLVDTNAKELEFLTPYGRQLRALMSGSP